MRDFASPLSYRLRRARYMRERYRRDPEFRLSEINRKRAYNGLPPHPNLGDVKGRIEA